MANSSRCMSWGTALTLLCAAPFFAAPASAGGAGDVIGETIVYRVSTADTFRDLATQFHVGYVELLAANPGVNPWLPGPGTEIMLPSAHVLPDVPREGLVLNLSEMRLYFFPPDGSEVQSYAIGIGEEGWETPMGATTVSRKGTDPAWYPPASIRAERPELPAVVPPGPDNPLGRHAIYLGWPAYLIHGTNNPAGVGRRVSHGCIRMYPEDIARLFPQVAPGTTVRVVDQPVKLGWQDGELWIEVHPTVAQVLSIEYRQEVVPDALPPVLDMVRAAAGDELARVDLRSVYQAAKDRTGVPVRITVPREGV